jgi:predicted ester cyclase
MLRAASPDLRFTVDDMIAEGDRVVTRWTARGTHKGVLFGCPPTGRPVTVEAIAIDRYVNGQITDHWAVRDDLGMMQQLGAIPAPQQAVA